MSDDMLAPDRISTQDLERAMVKAAEDEFQKSVLVGDWLFIAHIVDVETGSSEYVTLASRSAPRHSLRGLSNELSNKVHRMD